VKTLQYAVYSNKGKVRLDNEDSYLIKENPHTIIAVADGMGGHQAGEIASQLAVNSLENHNFKYDDLTKEIISFITETNNKILSKGKTELEFEGMGTTLSMGIIYDKKLYIGHVGDSRIYLFRDNQLKQLTTDHSLVNELLKNNQITCQEAFNHPQKNIITQALGTSMDLMIENEEIDLVQGDKLIFSTDGLHDMLRFNEIEGLLNANKDINKLSSLLGEEAMNKGGNDNITLIIVEIN